jgi:rhodanese-related sulfurtransferase
LHQAGQAVFVDARTEAERAVSTLPDAVTETAFLADPARFAGKKIIIYCTIGYRSGLLVKVLARQGIPAVNLAGEVYVRLDDGSARRIHSRGRIFAIDAQGLALGSRTSAVMGTPSVRGDIIAAADAEAREILAEARNHAAASVAAANREVERIQGERDSVEVYMRNLRKVLDGAQYLRPSI